MTNVKPDKNLVSNIDFDSLEIEKNIDKDIDKYIKEFNVNNADLDLIHIPNDLKSSIKIPFKELKKEKRKNLRYKILDLTFVLIILLPVIGAIYPNIFIKAPKVYGVFENINEFIQIDNLKSFIGIGKEVVEGSESSSVETIYIKEKEIKKTKGNNEAIKLIHSLANTLVEAEYKWQCSEVTPKTIDLALEGVEEIKNDYDRMHLRNSLTKWKSGDFSNAVEVHNYVWEMLDGNVGKAEVLDKDKIQSILNEYY